MQRLTFILIFLIATTIFAQDKGSISGKIVDLEMNNEPMLYANVRLKGHLQTTETNFHGNFEFKDILVGEYLLIVSHAGYDKLEIQVYIEKNKVSNIKGGLSQKAILLNDLVLGRTSEKEFSLTTGSK